MQMFYIAVVLPEELNEKVLVHKKWMQEKYRCRVGLKSPAHITLIAPFWTEPQNEGALKTDIQTISDTVTPFHLSTNNFSAFRPRTIFVALDESAELNALKKATEQFFRGKNYGMKFENRAFHPHITIATRDLHKKDFAEAWPHFENKEFKEECEVKGMSLMKHNGRSWDVAFTSDFRG